MVVLVAHWRAAAPVAHWRAVVDHQEVLDRDGVDRQVNPDQAERVVVANPGPDVHRSDDRSLDLPVDAGQTLDPLVEKVRPVARSPAEERLVGLLSQEVLEVLGQADLLQTVHSQDLSVFRVAANLDQDDRVAMAILDRDDDQDDPHRMEVRCNTKFLL